MTDGQRLYLYYFDEMAYQGVEVDEWDDLEAYEQQAWDEAALKFRAFIEQES